MAVLAAWYSPTADEIAQLPAGLYHLEQGRWGLARANPPLVRLVAAIPVWWAGYRSDWTHVDLSPAARSEFRVGQDFLAANGPRAMHLFTLARWACLPLAALGGWVCWRWAGALYGPQAGLAAAALWCFCPNVLGNGALMTPDVGCASLGVWAGFRFWRWLRESSWTVAVVAGIGLGLANLAKAAWLVLLVLWPLLTLFWIVASPGAGRIRAVVRRSGQLALAVLVAGLLVQTLYRFEGVGMRLGDYPFVSPRLTSRTAAAPGEGAINRFRGTWLTSLPIPLPREYLLGLDTQLASFDRGRPAFLLGQWKHGGWWYYYLVAALFKVPLGAWVLLVLAIAYRLGHGLPTAMCRDEVVLLAPAVGYLLVISMLGGINRHFRYVLPALPLVYLWLSSAVSCMQEWAPQYRGVALGAHGWFVLSSLSVLPHSQTYFNELCGGPDGGYRVPLGSNVDWGQHLYFLQRWVREHPEAQPLYGALSYGGVRPELFGITLRPVPKAPHAGWYAVSVDRLYDPSAPCPYRLHLRPVATVAYAIHIYHIPPGAFPESSPTANSTEPPMPPRPRPALAGMQADHAPQALPFKATGPAGGAGR